MKRKIVFLLWADTPGDEYPKRLLTELVPQLKALPGIVGLQLNIADADVAGAADLRMENSASGFDAMCSLYCDGQEDVSILERLLGGYAAQLSRYHVDEFERLANTSEQIEAGQRTPGFSQVALLRCPARLEYAEWLRIWQQEHTAVALATQSTFRYVQNVVTELAGTNVGCYHAIVEECFPEQAMVDSQVFYNAKGDADKCQRNMQKMIESCSKFIDFDEIDVIPTSEYCF